MRVILDSGSGFRRAGAQSLMLGLLLMPCQGLALTNLSVWAFPSPGGRVMQQPDALGNRVLDYSGVGYKGGLVPLPSSNTVPVRVTISPVAGDNVANVQNAINAVAAMPLDTNGFRGAVLLSAGEYPLGSTIRITASGVVLRGVGSGTNGTRLRATATNQYTLISIAGSGSASTVSGTTHNLTNNYVPVGARSFFVDSTSGLAVGDHVFVRRVATSNWIHDLGMDLLCCPPDVNPWTPSGYNIDYDRIIRRIEANHVFVDAPITCAIDAHYTNGTVRKFTWTGRISNVGVERLRGVSDYTSSTDENHGWTLVQFNTIENGWARDVTSQYFGYSCVSLASGAKCITVADCQSLDPVSVITGGRRYAFVLDDCVLCLVQNCYTELDRHQFVTQSLTTGPNVFVDGLSDSAKSDAGPHHRWGTGALWDNVTVNGNNLNVQNRGNLGSGHGWAGANELVWNCDADGGYVVQNPPGAHNWLIGSVGPIENGTVYVGPHDPGTYDSHGSNVFPNSLYYAQLQDRQAAPNLQTFDYWLGNMNAFTNRFNPGAVAVPVDVTWRTTVQAAAGAEPLDGFDVVTNNHWVPFTFNFNLAPGERVIGATLSLCLLSAGASATNDALYLDSVSNSLSFANLGWLPISTAATNPTVRVLDLSNQLGLLSDGRLNVAVQDDVGLDWALLELNVGPALDAGPLTLLPVADATVRGGASANSNFGASTTLTVKEDASADNDRRAYLRWDLSAVTGTVYQAKVRLTPVSVGTNGIEQGVSPSTSDTWSETGITWNNQPGGGKRFATWMPGTNGPVEIMVTPQVLDALAGDKQLSLQLFSLRNVGGAGIVDYASREHPDAASRPQLVLLVPDAPPVISGITNLAIAVNSSTGPVPFTVGDDKTAASDLLVGGASSNTNLVPEANIVFGGSGSNRTVTVTPTANRSGLAVITVTVTDSSGLTSSDSFTLTVSSHPPSAFVWNGPGAGAHNWSASADWSPAGPPEALDDVRFFDPGAAGVAVSNINNFLDAAFGGTVASLRYSPTNGNHTTLVGAGNLLSVSGTGGLTVGTETDNGNAQTVFATLTGPGGALVMDNPEANLIVRQGAANSGGSQRATLDLSGLGTFRATLSQVLVGFAGPVNRATGTLYLAKTNHISVTGLPGIGAGDNSSNNGGQHFIYLGQTNAIFADSITIARQKATATLSFPQSLPTPSAWFRGADGLSRVGAWNIADHSLQSASSSACNGTNDFTGGTVNALVDTLTLGKSQKTTGADSTGVLTFTSGTIDVNTLQIGFQTQSGAISAGTGRVNVNGPGALLVANTVLELGHTSGGAGTTNTFGALSVAGGTVLANAIAAGANSGPNSIALNNATLVLTNTAGTPGSPIHGVALTNSTLQFSVVGGATNLVAASLTTGGAGNTIVIAALPNIPAFPAQFTLITYAGAIAGAGCNFVLAPLPAGSFCGGYLSNNLAHTSVDLIVTNCAVPDAFLTWDGSVDGDWDTKTANWKNNLGADLTYADGRGVLFNDTASGTTNVSLTTTLTPASVTVSNNLKTYAFVDLGKLSGSSGLSKQGPGTLIIANEGANDFTGGVVLDGGTVRVGNGSTNGILPAGNVVNNASLVFNHSDNLTSASLISGSGSLTQDGEGVLTLAAANTFNGAVLVGRGTLKVGSASALGATGGPTIVSNGATLDLNHLNVGLEPVTASGAGTGGNGALVDNSGNPSYVSPSVAYVTLAGDTTFGGTGRWDLRSASTSTTNAVLSTTGHAYKLTKVGTNQVSLVAVLVDPALGDINVQAGTLSVEKVINSLGNPTNILSVANGATLQFYQVSNVLSKVLVLRGGATVLNNSGSNIFGGPVTLQGINTFNAGGTWLRFTNVLSGPGGLMKTGSSNLVLSGVNTYTGDTLVNGGTLALTGTGSIASSRTITVASGATLDVGARDDLKLTLTSGQNLTGNGTVTPSLLVVAGATVSPGSGSALGTLTVSGTATLQGTSVMKVDKAQARTNDQLVATGAVRYGGTLFVTNVNPGLALQAGDSLKLFSFGNFLGGSFTLLPATPGPGLVWDTNLLASSGVLSVLAAPVAPPIIGSIALTGGSLVISGSGGAPMAGYYVLSSTNLILPRANWPRLLTNSFDSSGSFSVTHPIAPGSPQRFYLLQLQ